MDVSVIPGKIYRYKISDVAEETNAETFHSEITVVADRSIISNKLVPQACVLHDAYPNPFNPITTIKFDLPSSSHVSLKIYDIDGKLIKSLIDSGRESGYHSVEWDGTDNNGQIVSSGVYFYRITSNGLTATKSMTLLK